MPPDRDGSHSRKVTRIPAGMRSSVYRIRPGTRRDHNGWLPETRRCEPVGWPVIRRTAPRPERMFCEHGPTDAYCFSRHSYSAIRALTIGISCHAALQSLVAASVRDPPFCTGRVLSAPSVGGTQTGSLCICPTIQMCRSASANAPTYPDDCRPRLRARGLRINIRPYVPARGCRPLLGHTYMSCSASPPCPAW